MQTLEKRVLVGGKIVKRYELAVAETIEECLQLVDGHPERVVALFNKGYSQLRHAEERPKTKSKSRDLSYLLRTVSPEVRELLKQHSPEEATELVRQAKERVANRKAGEPQ